MLRPVGVNLPNLFHYYLGTAPGNAATARALIDSARAQGFTHARFIASGYWPADMTRANGWRTSPAAYWAAFDAMVADARARGLRLIPSMLFNVWLWADLSQAPMGAVFTPGTPARALTEQYIRELVTRYASEPAIAMWELGNELNLDADLEHAGCSACDGGTRCGNLAPSLGTACARSAADNFYSCNSCRGVTTAQQDLGQFAAAIAQLVKSLDPLGRPFTTGHAFPRASAWHLGQSPCPACDWTSDSPAEFALALTQLHPAPVDMVSVHHYPGPEAARFGDIDESAGVALLERTQTIVAGMGKQLYVGEYGERRAGTVTCGGYTEVCGGDPDAVATRRMLASLVEKGVALSALWSFEFHQFCPAVPQCASVETADNVVPFLAKAQRASGTCSGQPDGAACPLGRCTAQACAPVRVGAFDFDVPGDEQAWLAWTNCSGCVDGTRTRSGGALMLNTFTLQCSGTCMYPGVYALSPQVPISGSELLVRFDARSSGASAILRLIFEDTAGTEISHAERAIAMNGSLRTWGAWALIPAGATRVRVRLEALSENATLTIDRLVFHTAP